MYNVEKKWDLIIQKYLEEDRGVSELETNGDTSVFVRKGGKRIEVTNVFSSIEEYRESIKYLIKRINRDAPADTKFIEEGTLRLANEGIARCHIMLPPACDEPMVTIARKTQDLTTLDDLEASGSFNKMMGDFIRAAVDCDMTLCLSGSTGSGKTTMLEAITKLWPNNIRIGVVEDAPELRLIQDNVAYLHSSVAKPGQPENSAASLQWCVAQLNRMRVDKMIIGETRGPEFASFLTAANSGNEGSLTTIHANDPAACLKKMNQFVNLAQTSPQRVINQNIASTIDLIIQLNKTPSGRYRTTYISEVTRQLGNDDAATIATQPIFEYSEATDDWSYTPISDHLAIRFREKGYNSKFRKEIGNVEDDNNSRPMFNFGR